MNRLCSIEGRVTAGRFIVKRHHFCSKVFPNYLGLSSEGTVYMSDKNSPILESTAISNLIMATLETITKLGEALY